MCKVTTSKWQSQGSKRVSKNPEAVLESPVWLFSQMQSLILWFQRNTVISKKKEESNGRENIVQSVN